MDVTRKPDFVTPAGVKCKPCNATATVNDINPQADQIWATLEWGPLVDYEGVSKEAFVDGYAIKIVDSKGRILENVGEAKKVPSSSSCCKPNLYSISIAGLLPTGYDKFMIVPMIGNTELPMGHLTATITDLSAGAGQTVDGTLNLAVTDTDAIINNKAAWNPIRDALAEQLSDIDNSQVRIVGITVAPGGRRLDGRRLAAGTLLVNWQILLPEGFTGAVPTAAAINANAAALKTAINAKLVAAGIPGAANMVTGVTATVAAPQSVGNATAPVFTPSVAFRSSPMPVGLVAALALSWLTMLS